VLWKEVYFHLAVRKIHWHYHSVFSSDFLCCAGAAAQVVFAAILFPEFG
jgi:hypothetical protein